MFYAAELLCLRKNKKGRLPRCWLAATIKSYLSRLPKKEINSVEVDRACEDIIEGLVGHEGKPRLSLYLSAQLSFGAIKIFQCQVNNLYEETLKLLTIPRLPKKKSKRIKVADPQKGDKLENLDIDQSKDDKAQHLLDTEIPTFDIEKLFPDLEQMDRNQLKEIDEYEVNKPFRLPSLDMIDRFLTLPPGSDIGEFIANFPTVQHTPIGDDIEQRAPTESSAWDNEHPATPKRKSRKEHDETPKKRKRILIADSPRSPTSHHSVRQSLINRLIPESIEANTAHTDNLDIPMNESPQQAQMPDNNQRFSPPTESTGTAQMPNRGNIDEVVANPIIEVSELSTVAADESVNHPSSELLRPEQLMNLPRSQTPTSIAPEDQTNVALIQQTDAGQESEFVLPEIDKAAVISSPSRRKLRVFKDTNKQIKIKYISASNALDNIYTRTLKSCLPDVHGKIPANSLMSLPSIRLNVEWREDKFNCYWVAKLRDQFMNNTRTSYASEFNLDQLAQRDDFVNKRRRRSIIQRRESSTVQSRSKSAAPIIHSPSHSEMQIDHQLMPPPSAPVSVVHSYEHHSTRPSRGFPELIEPSGLAESPRQARQRNQPLAIEHDDPADLPPAEAALPTDDPPEADQGIVEANIQPDIPMQINEPVHISETEVRTEPPSSIVAMSDESFLAGVRWQSTAEIAQNETENADSLSLCGIFITRDEFHELLQKLWAVMIEFGKPPRLSFDDVFIKEKMSVFEVLRYLKYLFEFEQKSILCIKAKSPFDNYICKLEALQ